MVGRTLNHYKIVSELGSGGMGEVYLAQDTKLHRQVALKVLASAVADDVERRARFEREARAVAALNHPNIVTIHSVEEAQGLHFITMELVRGKTLSELIPAGGLALDELFRLAIPLADAVSAAHEKGITHRDLKPANVMLTKEGRVKVLDFGLAKVWVLDGTDTSLTYSPTLTARMTQVGVILGTAAYMSPEQARGQDVDKRSDIWAFGVLLYEMLTGDQLFAGNTATDILGAIVHCSPDWDRLPDDTPTGVVRLLKRCLTQELPERLRDIGEARHALSHLDEEAPQPAADAATPAASSMVWKIAAGVLLALSAALSAAFLLSPQDEQRILRATIVAPAGNRLLAVRDRAGPVRVSPDGRSLVFVAQDEKATSRVWVRSLDSAESRPIPGTEGGHRPFWSPDSRSLAFFSDGQLRRVSLAGGAPLAVASAPDARGGSWSPEGVIVFAPTSGSELHVVAAGGGETRQVTDFGQAGSRETSHREPRFLPDGRHFLYLAQSEITNWKVYVGDIDGGTSKALTTSSGGAVHAEGYLLTLRDTTLVAQPFDTGTHSLSGDPMPVAEKVTLDPAYGIGVFSASPPGVLAYQAGSRERNELTWLDGSGNLVGTAGQPDAYDQLALSPDGTRAAVIINEADGIRDVWVVDLAHGTRTRLTFSTKEAPGVHSDPVWSPDGREIIFSAKRTGTYDLYRKAADGSGEETLLLDAVEDLWVYDWSPDGKFVVYGHERPEHDGAEDLFVVPVSGEGDPIRLLDTPFNEWPAEFSPDGRWLAYDSPESGRREIYVVPFPGMDSRWQVSTEGGRFPQWSPDGNRLYFWNGGNLMAVQLQASGSTLQVGTTEKVFNTSWGSAFAAYAVAPDGERFLALTSDTGTGPPTLSLFLNWQEELENR